MKKSKIIILSIVLITVFAGIFLFISFKKNSSVDNESSSEVSETANNGGNGVSSIDGNSKTGLTKSLTDSDILRLQKYSYEKKPIQSFEEIQKEDPEEAKWIADTLFSHMITFEAHEKFFTNEKLTYMTWNKHFAVRGIYQVKQSDGTFTEQDFEYQYRFGDYNEDQTEIRLIYEGEKALGEKRVIRGGVQ